MAKLTNEEIIASLKEMSILELNDLVKAIEEEFGVTAAAPVAVAAVADDSANAGPSEVTVTLTDVGGTMVDKVPSVIKENIKPEEAEEIKKKLMEAGASVEVK